MDDEASGLRLREHVQALSCIILPEQLFEVGTLHRVENTTSGFDIPLQACVVKVALSIASISSYRPESLQGHAGQGPTRQAMIDGEQATSQSLLQTCLCIHRTAGRIVEPMRWLHGAADATLKQRTIPAWPAPASARTRSEF